MTVKTKKTEREVLAARLVRMGYTYAEFYHWTTEQMRIVASTKKGARK